MSSVEAQIAERLGGMWSPYDGTRFESLKDSDIEHIIAVSEAHDSGLCAASMAVRARFALATPELNRNEKRGHDAAEWLPERNRCWFATTIVLVRREYNLTIDRREADALAAVLEDANKRRWQPSAGDQRHRFAIELPKAQARVMRLRPGRQRAAWRSGDEAGIGGD